MSVYDVRYLSIRDLLIQSLVKGCMKIHPKFMSFALPQLKFVLPVEIAYYPFLSSIVFVQDVQLSLVICLHSH